jgi:hypothetical protein
MCSIVVHRTAVGALLRAGIRQGQSQSKKNDALVSYLALRPQPSTSPFERSEYASAPTKVFYSANLSGLIGDGPHRFHGTPDFSAGATQKGIMLNVPSKR